MLHPPPTFQAPPFSVYYPFTKCISETGSVLRYSFPQVAHCGKMLSSLFPFLSLLSVLQLRWSPVRNLFYFESYHLGASLAVTCVTARSYNTAIYAIIKSALITWLRIHFLEIMSLTQTGHMMVCSHVPQTKGHTVSQTCALVHDRLQGVREA